MQITNFLVMEYPKSKFQVLRYPRDILGIPFFKSYTWISLGYPKIPKVIRGVWFPHDVPVGLL